MSVRSITTLLRSDPAVLAASLRVTRARSLASDLRTWLHRFEAAIPRDPDEIVKDCRHPITNRIAKLCTRCGKTV